MWELYDNSYVPRCSSWLCFYYWNSICYTSASIELWYLRAHSRHSHCDSVLNVIHLRYNSNVWVQTTKGDGVGVQQVTEEGLIIWDRLPGLFSCSPKPQTHTYSHTPAAVWVDMTCMLPGLTLKEERARSLWSQLQADADSSRHTWSCIRSRFSFRQSEPNAVHSLSLSITHTLAHRRIVMGRHRPFIMPLCVFAAVTSDGRIQPFPRSDPMF